MDVIAAYREVGTYRGAAAMCGTTHKTVRRIIDAAGVGELVPPKRRRRRRRNYDVVRGLVKTKVETRRGGSPRSGCCPRPARRATRGRRGTSGGWSPKASPTACAKPEPEEVSPSPRSDEHPRSSWRAPAEPVYRATVPSPWEPHASRTLGAMTPILAEGIPWLEISTVVGGIAAAATLVGMAAKPLLSRRKNRDERERMARAVGVQAIASQDDTGQWFVDYTVHNGGRYPIDNAVLVVADPGAEDCRPVDQMGTAVEVVLGSIMPKETVKDRTHVHFTAEPAFGEVASLGMVLFTDAWHEHWARSPMGLERRPYPARSC